MILLNIILSTSTVCFQCGIIYAGAEIHSGLKNLKNTDLDSHHCHVEQLILNPVAICHLICEDFRSRKFLLIKNFI